jgi:hypothetical protein
MLNTCHTEVAYKSELCVVIRARRGFWNCKQCKQIDLCVQAVFLTWQRMSVGLLIFWSFALFRKVVMHAN